MLLTELLEEQMHRGMGDGQRCAQRRLQRLPIACADAKANLRPTRRWNLDAAENVPDQRLQPNAHALHVHRVDDAEAALYKRTEQFYCCLKPTWNHLPTTGRNLSVRKQEMNKLVTVNIK